MSKDRVMIELGLAPRPDGYVPPLWKRNKKGDVAHHYACSRATENARAWFWPETQDIGSDWELLWALPPWIRPCTVCFDLRRLFADDPALAEKLGYVEGDALYVGRQ